MKKCSLCILIISACMVSFSQTDLKRQAFLGASFLPDPGGRAGVTVQRIMEDSPVQLAGLQQGDVILKANGILLSDPYVYGKTFRSFRAGDSILLQVLRNDQLLVTTLLPTARPLETYPGIDVQYGSVITSKGHQVRTIFTKPRTATSKVPVIFVTQWLSCAQVELHLARMSSTDSLLYDLITKSGFAMMRVEKPGLGDSEGPDCSEADYESELAAYQAAYRALRKIDFIDTASIFVLGISIGSASAPLVFQDENIKGFIVSGGFYKTWYEHMLEIERRRLALSGHSPGETTGMLRKYIDFYNDYLHYKMTPKEIIEQKPYLSGIWYDGDAHQYGRPAVYYQQVQEKNVAAAWEKIDVPTLVIYGAYDWIMSREDHELMAEAVNKNKEGHGTFVIVPGMSHDFTIHPSLQDAFQDRNGFYTTEVSDLILKWLRTHQ